MINVFKEENSIIKYKVNDEIIRTYIKEYDKVLLNQEDFKKYIFKLFSLSLSDILKWK